MLIIGCDYHPGFQQIAWVDTETGIIVHNLLHDAALDAHARPEPVRASPSEKAQGYENYFSNASSVSPVRCSVI